jgi:hypothetical protein
MSKWTSNYFCGNEVSAYGQEHERIDYATLAKSFQHVLNNEIIGVTGWDAWNIENGDLFDEDDNEREIFQYFIIDDNGADILKDYTNEIVLYNNELGMYLWGVTHYGTSWDYVLTDIEIDA